MIASVAGRVAAIGPEHAVVEVGGVGIEVRCSPNTLATLRVGENTRLATSLVVREDSLTLYGFRDPEERTLFELLQTASGVGPRLAQAVLAVLSPDAVRRAISTGDTATLTRVPGIGKKGAQRLVLELRERIGATPQLTGASSAANATAPWREQVIGALVGLGWSQSQATGAVDALVVADDTEPDVPALLKQAIQMLGRGTEAR